MTIGDGQQRVISKLWNEHVDHHVTEGDQCKLANMLVNDWNKTTALTSTDETDYMVSDCMPNYDGTAPVSITTSGRYRGIGICPCTGLSNSVPQVEYQEVRVQVALRIVWQVSWV